MKKIYLGLFALLLGFGAQAQLVNDGATIIVKPGATLFVETNVTNSNAGTITVEGTLEVQGDLTNNATMTTTTGSLIKFSGTTASAFKSNGTVVENLEVSKSNQNVTLVDNLTVKTKAEFAATAGQSSKLVLGANDLTMQSGASFMGADADEYVVADGAGAVVKETGSGALGSPFEYAVGDADEYSPINATYAGTATTGTISVNVVDAAVSPLPGDATDFISRYWNVDATGYTSGYTNNLDGTYINSPSDIAGTVGKIKGASFDGSTWSYLGAAGTAPNVIGTITAPSTKFTGTNFYGKVNLTVFLAGALPATGVPPMSTTLNALLPTTTPYNVSPWNAPTVTGTPFAGVTDWILVEARDASNPATLLTQTSAFLKNDGTIVNTDGTPLTLKDANPTSHIAIKHRNHLAIRTASPLDLATATTTAHNFATGTSQAYTNPSIVSNNNMIQIGSTFAMWGGNGNSNTTVNYGAFNSDRSALLSNPNTLGLLTRGLGNVQVPSPAITGVYGNNDLNMNGAINYGAFNSDRSFLLSTMLGNTQTNTRTQHF